MFNRMRYSITSLTSVLSLGLALSCTSKRSTATGPKSQTHNQTTIGVNYTIQPSYDAVLVVKAHNLSYVMNNIAASLTSLGLDLSNETVHGTVRTSENYTLVRLGAAHLPSSPRTGWPGLLISVVIKSLLERVSCCVPRFYHYCCIKSLTSRRQGMSLQRQILAQWSTRLGMLEPDSAGSKSAHQLTSSRILRNRPCNSD